MEMQSIANKQSFFADVAKAEISLSVTARTRLRDFVIRDLSGISLV